MALAGLSRGVSDWQTAVGQCVSVAFLGQGAPAPMGIYRQSIVASAMSVAGWSRFIRVKQISTIHVLGRRCPLTLRIFQLINKITGRICVQIIVSPTVPQSLTDFIITYLPHLADELEPLISRNISAPS